MLLHSSIVRHGTYEHSSADLLLDGEDKPMSPTLAGTLVGGGLGGPGGALAGGALGLLAEALGLGREYEAAALGEAAEKVAP